MAEVPHNHPLRTAGGLVPIGPFFVQDCVICHWIERDKLLEEMVEIFRALLDEPDVCYAASRDCVARMTAIVEEHP